MDNDVKLMFSILVSKELYEKWVEPILTGGEPLEITFGPPLVKEDDPRIEKIVADVEFERGFDNSRYSSHTTIEFEAHPRFKQWYKEQEPEGKDETR